MLRNGGDVDLLRALRATCDPTLDSWKHTLNECASWEEKDAGVAHEEDWLLQWLEKGCRALLCDPSDSSLCQFTQQCQEKQTVPKSGDSAKELHERGNRVFRDGKWETALSLFTQALLECPQEGDHQQRLVALLSNRAACHIKMAQWERAQVDCRAALALDPGNEKAAFRLEYSCKRWDGSERGKELTESPVVCSLGKDGGQELVECGEAEVDTSMFEVEGRRCVAKRELQAGESCFTERALYTVPSPPHADKVCCLCGATSPFGIPHPSSTRLVFCSMSCKDRCSSLEGLADDLEILYRWPTFLEHELCTTSFLLATLMVLQQYRDSPSSHQWSHLQGHLYNRDQNELLSMGVLSLLSASLFACHLGADPALFSLRFLHAYEVVQVNSFGCSNCASSPSSTSASSSPSSWSSSGPMWDLPVTSLALYRFAPMLNHSCYPSCRPTYRGSTITLVLLHGVAQGEELTHSYGPHRATMPREDRQEMLLQAYKFTCQCEACQHMDISDRLKCCHCESPLEYTLSSISRPEFPMQFSCPQCGQELQHTTYNQALVGFSGALMKADRLKSESFEEAYESFKDACRLVASVVEPSTSISYCNVLDRMAEAVAVEGRHPQRRNQPLQVVSLNLMVKTLDILGALYAPYDLEIGTALARVALLFHEFHFEEQAHTYATLALEVLDAFASPLPCVPLLRKIHHTFCTSPPTL